MPGACWLAQDCDRRCLSRGPRNSDVNAFIHLGVCQGTWVKSSSSVADIDDNGQFPLIWLANRSGTPRYALGKEVENTPESEAVLARWGEAIARLLTILQSRKSMWGVAGMMKTPSDMGA